MLQLFTNGLITPPHHWLVAFEILVQPPPPAEETKTLHILHDEKNPLKATKKDCDFIIENILNHLEKKKVKVTTAHIIDLGPVGTVLNKANRGLYRAKA